MMKIFKISPKGLYISKKIKNGGERMFLFKNVDLKKTEQNVLDFFDQDYQTLKMKSGANLKSPALSLAPSSENNLNTKEAQFTKIIYYRNILDAVNRSVASCSHVSQQIINERVIGDAKIDMFMQQIGVSSYATYYELLNVATNEFADAFESQAEPYFEGGENDLHVYVKS